MRARLVFGVLLLAVSAAVAWFGFGALVDWCLGCLFVVAAVAYLEAKERRE